MFMQNLGHIDLVDDDIGLTEAMHHLLTSVGHEVRVWTDPLVFLSHLPNQYPSVIITDMCMKGMSGLELHRQLIAMGCTVPIIYISAVSTPRQTIQAMKLGAHDFLIKPFDRQELLDAVALGMLTHIRLSEIKRQQAERQRSLLDLTPREREVLFLMCSGYGNAEIVDALHISLATTKQYKTQIKQKLQLNSLSELMQFTQGLALESDSVHRAKSQWK